MYSCTKKLQNLVAAATGTSALVGYIVLNLASKDLIGLPLAITAGAISGPLNAIFHALPIQQAEMPKTLLEGGALILANGVSTLATGYIYASAEAATSQIISDSPYVTIPIALSYQASYALPIGFLLQKVSLKLLSTLNEASINLLKHLKGSKAPSETSALLSINDASKPVQTETQASETLTLGQRARRIGQQAALQGLYYGIGTGLVITLASSAYTLFKGDEHVEQELSMIDRNFYRPLYGTNFPLTLTLHSPMFLLAAWSVEEGLQAIKETSTDLVRHPAIDKCITGLLSLAVLGFTLVTTYVISSYGEVDIPVLALSLLAAGLGNYVSAIRLSRATYELGQGQIRRAAECFTDATVITSFRNTPSVVIEDNSSEDTVTVINMGKT